MVHLHTFYHLVNDGIIIPPSFTPQELEAILTKYIEFIIQSVCAGN